MVIVDGYTPQISLPKPGFDSHAVQELPVMLGESRSELGALSSEKKVSFGVKMP